MKPETTLRAGCFGKLPIHGDFIRHHAGTPEVEKLDQWFQEGITFSRQLLGARFEEAWAGAPVSRFVFRPAGAPRCLVGVVSPGIDRSGRRFPFASFLTADCAPFDRDASIMPLMFDGFLGQSQEIASRDWTGADLKQLVARIDSLGPVDLAQVEPFRQDYAAFLRNEKASSFWGALFGSFEHEGKVALLSNLLEIFGPAHSGQRGRLALGLRFPLMPSTPVRGTALDVSFWLDLTFRLAGRRGVPPLVFWTRRESPAGTGLLLSLGDAAPAFFLALIQPGFESERICDLDRASADALGRDRFKERFRSILEDPDLALADLITTLAGSRENRG